MDVRAVLIGVRAAASMADGTSRLTRTYELEGVEVARLMADLGLASAGSRIVLLNGQPVREDHILRDGDEVVVVSPLGGG